MYEQATIGSDELPQPLMQMRMMCGPSFVVSACDSQPSGHYPHALLHTSTCTGDRATPNAHTIYEADMLMTCGKHP